jgi:hypothetical protein
MWICAQEDGGLCPLHPAFLTMVATVRGQRLLTLTEEQCGWLVWVIWGPSPEPRGFPGKQTHPVSLEAIGHVYRSNWDQGHTPQIPDLVPLVLAAQPLTLRTMQRQLWHPEVNASLGGVPCRITSHES